MNSTNTVLVDSISNNPQVRDPSYATLQDLVLVNTNCYVATAPTLDRNLSLQISSQRELQIHCDRIGVGRSNHTQCLKLWGRMLSLADTPTAYGDSGNNTEEYDDEFHEILYAEYPDGSAKEVCDSWQPLAVLIRNNFKHISDFIWVCKNQLTSCLLEALEQPHPFCRLHIRTFRLRSLRVPEGETASSIEIQDDNVETYGIADLYEQRLIRSPLIHSISIRTAEHDSKAKMDYTYEAIFHVAVLSSPPISST
jgi:hypothetical protein